MDKKSFTRSKHTTIYVYHHHHKKKTIFFTW